MRKIGQIFRVLKNVPGGCGVPVKYGRYGGQFVSTLIQTALNELETTYLSLCDDANFRKEVTATVLWLIGRSARDLVWVTQSTFAATTDALRGGMTALGGALSRHLRLALRTLQHPARIS